MSLHEEQKYSLQTQYTTIHSFDRDEYFINAYVQVLYVCPFKLLFHGIKVGHRALHFTAIIIAGLFYGWRNGFSLLKLELNLFVSHFGQINNRRLMIFCCISQKIDSIHFQTFMWLHFAYK